MAEDFKIINDPIHPGGKPIPQVNLLEWTKMHLEEIKAWDARPLHFPRRFPTPREVHLDSVREAIRGRNLIWAQYGHNLGGAMQELGRAARGAAGAMFKFRQQYGIVTGWDRAGDGFTTMVRMRRNPDGTMVVLSLVQNPDPKFPRRRGESDANHLDRVFRTIQRGKR